MRAIGIFERIGDGSELRAVLRRRLGEIERAHDSLEPFVKRVMREVLLRDLRDDVGELGQRREAREEALLFVLFVTLHLTREELGDVAHRHLVEDLGARRLAQIGQSLFEAAMRARELLEGIGPLRIVHFFPNPICARIGAASFIARWYDGRSRTRFAYAETFS